MSLQYIENQIHRKVLDVRNNQYVARIIRSAQIISRGRCGGEYHIVDPNQTLYGKITTADSAGINIHTTLMAAINAARYKTGMAYLPENIDYDDDHHATVIVLPGDYSSEGRIAFSAKNVHIIGLGLPGTDTGVTIRPSSPSGFAFGGSGTGVEIANIAIAVDSAAIGLFWEMMDGSSWFHNNVIMGDGSNATYGIYTEGIKSSVIENNRISGFVTSGIYVAGGTDRYFLDGKIIGNQIGAKATCATAIFIQSAATLVTQNALIAHNYIIGDDFTKTIDVDNTAADVLVADNWGYAAGEGGTERDNHYT